MTFEGEHSGSSPHGDISIDDVSFTPECRPAPHGKVVLSFFNGNYASYFSVEAGFHQRRSRSRSRKSASVLVKIKNRSGKRSHKLDGIGVGRIRTVPFSSDSAYDSDAYGPVKTRLSESQAEAEELTSHSAGFILWLRLTTPTI